MTINDEQKKKFLDCMQQQKLMVIATVGDAKPESALIAFVETEKLQIVFGTSNLTRKYANLANNKNVALVIGLDAPTTIQYEGVVRELVGEEVATYSAMLAVKNPRAAKFMNDEYQRYFLVEPTWIRYTGYSATGEDIFEVL